MKLNLDNSFFDIIDTEEKAYFLGWMLADGTISNNQNIISLEVGIKDIDIIYKFRDTLKSEHAIGIRRHGDHISARLQFRSSHMVKSLASLGVVSKKSLIAIAPVIQSDLERHFWRGVVDGDGHINISRYEYMKQPVLQLVGSRYLLEQFKKWTCSIVRHKCSVQSRLEDRSYQIQLLGKTALAIVSTLYDDAKVYLDRKYKSYLEISKETNWFQLRKVKTKQ
jgi:hypothetical protein